MKVKLLGLSALLLTACSSPEPTSTVESFRLVATSKQVEQGESETLNVYVEATRNYKGQLKMLVEGSHPGITVNAPDTYTLPNATTMYYAIGVTVDKATPIGKYLYTVISNDGSKRVTTTATVEVVAASGGTPVPTPTPNHPRFPHGYHPPCTSDYPIKGNLSSSGERIYHVPGGAYYNSTIPEVCFITETDARLDGFRRSSR